MDCTFGAEQSFGPAVAPCRRAFDFTLFFDELFFKLLPSVLFLVAAGVRIAVLARWSSPRVRFGVLYYAKIAVTAVFAALELALLILASVGSRGRTSITVATAALCFVASVALLALSHIEHVRSAASSDILGFYLLITPLLRAAVVRTYWYLDGYDTIAYLSLTSLLVQLIILALESCSKRRWLISEGPGGTPEECASFLSRSLLAWINRLFLIGFQSLGLYALTPILPRLALSAFTFAQPFLASSLIDFLGGSRNAPDNNGFAQEVWIAPIETGIGTWLLWRQVGPSSLTALGIVLVCTVASFFIGKRSAVQQRVWLSATEKRIQATKHMLSSLKAIKMTGADTRAAATIQKLRNLEFESSKTLRRLLVGGLFSCE
ncbi:hypothetical protein ONZ43_g5194 [Nemania bipapillata]|uniref:Uncharacterized protein n=1 Tax=Nemania bipapillata TaxID=110536 RepID=A0ACC2IDP6_9PEZI|nr:hypothetical protein ONZ43_g5194 [Nemania bipapillata]